MNALILRNRFQGNTTLLDNEFIDHYMVKANGEYVKVYLLLLRHINNPSVSLSISQIADCLDHTESDIVRALKYWEKEQLLTLEYNELGQVIGLEMGKVPRSVTTSAISTPAASTPVKATTQAPQKPLAVSGGKNRKELKQLLFIAEQYLGRTLSRTDVDAITYFYDTLNFSADLVEYLIEYCVENNHRSIHYIQKVAISWADANITTVEQARNSSAIYNKTCYSILNAFGIKGRGPAASEMELIKKWTEADAFDLAIILEACNRTISAIHQPSFEYADKILSNWKLQNVRTIADIQRIDQAFEQNKTAKKVSTFKPVSSNPEAASKFRNFEERSYDMDELTKELLHM